MAAAPIIPGRLAHTVNTNLNGEGKQMDELGAWQRFEATGRIEDYLVYSKIHSEGAAAVTQPPEAESNADNHNGNCDTNAGA